MSVLKDLGKPESAKIKLKVKFGKDKDKDDKKKKVKNTHSEYSEPKMKGHIYE